MNLSPSWHDLLVDEDHEVVHWSNLGRPDASDEEILDLARAQGWVVVTQDLDFGRLLALGEDKLPSVIQIRAQATLPQDIGPQLVSAIKATVSHLDSGALVTLTAADFRVTILPLRRAPKK
jgi:predicted nuclease of predicted toxin-antitoxin system